MDKPLKVLNGSTGQLEVYPNKIVLRRKGLLAKLNQGFFQGDRTLFISQITGIQVKKAGFITAGFIEFVTGGTLEVKSSLLQKTHNENAIFFTKKDNELAEEIRTLVEGLIEKNQGRGQSASAADEIAKFKRLLDDDVISQEEFEKKKKELLT